MATATLSQQKAPQTKAPQSAGLLRKRRELLEQALKLGRVPAAAELADVDRRFGDGTAAWLLDEVARALALPEAGRQTLLQSAASSMAPGPDEVAAALAATAAYLAAHHKAADIAELEARLKQLAEAPGNETEIALVQAALAEAKEDKRGWHAQDAKQKTLKEGKREGFDSGPLKTRGVAVSRDVETQTHTTAQKGLNIHAHRLTSEEHDEGHRHGTNTHVAQQKQLTAGDGIRQVRQSRTETTRGDARTVEKVAAAKEKLEKKAKADKAKAQAEAAHPGEKGLAAAARKAVTQHEFTVASTQKEWSTRGEADNPYEIAKGMLGSVTGELHGPGASASAGGAAKVGLASGVALSGNVAVKAVAFEGGVKYTTPEMEFTLAGEKLRAIAEVAFKAEALAEAKGQVKLNILARADGLDIDVGQNGGRGVGASGSVEAFAGLRAGVDSALKLDWLKKPDYFAELRDKLLDFFQNTVGLPGGRVAAWILEKANKVLFGAAGWVNLLKAAASLEGSAGIGGSAAFDAAFSGGRVKFSAKLKGTLGLGFGGKASIDASILEGMRIIAVLTARGGGALAEQIGLSAERILGPAKQKLLALL